MKNDLNIFVPFDLAKANEEDRTVEGVASSEALDSQGEVVKFEAIKKALPHYLGDYSQKDGRFQFGNIREMHQASAVGKTMKAALDEVGKKLVITAKIVDDAAWKKVKEGIYTGFSIGGAALRRIGNEIHDLSLSEISLVDRPANPLALFSMVKFDNADIKKCGMCGCYDCGCEQEVSTDANIEQANSAHEAIEAICEANMFLYMVQDLLNLAYGKAMDGEDTSALEEAILKLKTLAIKALTDPVEMDKFTQGVALLKPVERKVNSPFEKKWEKQYREIIKKVL